MELDKLERQLRNNRVNEINGKDLLLLIERCRQAEKSLRLELEKSRKRGNRMQKLETVALAARRGDDQGLTKALTALER